MLHEKVLLWNCVLQKEMLDSFDGEENYMTLKNKLNIADSAELARQEEKFSNSSCKANPVDLDHLHKTIYGVFCKSGCVSP